MQSLGWRLLVEEMGDRTCEKFDRALIDRHPSETQRLLGMKDEQLMDLIIQAEGLHAQKQAEIERKKTRIIKSGAGRHRKLTVADEIILTLVSWHQLPTIPMLIVQIRST